MTTLQRLVLHNCIEELERTLGQMPANEADNVVREVKEMLRFILDKEEAE